MTKFSKGGFSLKHQIKSVEENILLLAGKARIMPQDE
jgi:hypothetical protein